MTTRVSAPSPTTVVFYDGVCGLCNRLNQFLLRRDHDARIRFAALQSPIARQLLAAHGLDPADLDTVYVMADWTTAAERVLARSQAVLHALGQLGGPWRALAMAGRSRTTAARRPASTARSRAADTASSAGTTSARSRRRNGASAFSISSTLTRAMNEIHHPDGRVELRDTSRIERSPLYNHDLAPVPLAARTWTTYNYAALWISMAHCIPTYMLASGLMASGMNWWQALITILLGNTIVLVPILLNSHPGHEVRHPVSGLRARRLRHDRLEPPGADARARRLRLVRHPGVDRRRSAADVLRRARSPAGRNCSAAASPATRRPSGCRSCSSGASTSSSSTAGWTCCAWVENWAAPFVLVMTAVLLVWAVAAGQRPRTAARAARKAQHVRRVLPGVHPVADRDDRLLGDALAQHARLHALRPQPARADRRPGRRPADDDVGVCGDGRAHHERDGRHLRRGDLGSGQARRPVRHAARRRHLDVHGRRRHARRQHRGQRRLAGQRLRQRVPAAHRLQDRRADHRACWRS